MKQISTTKGAGSLKLVLSLFAFGILATGAAIMYGRMDTGVINVSATISNANQASQARGEDASNQVQQPSSEIFKTMPNGGLVGTGKTEPTPPPVETGTTTATTTESGATTTPDGSVTGETDENANGEAETPVTQTEPAPENGTE